MSVTKATLLAIFTFVLGAGTGAYAASRFWAELVDSFSISSAGAGVSTHVLALRSLRESKDADAIELLENVLDGDLISLGARDPKGFTTQTLRSLKQASDYRAKYPHSIGTGEVEEAISRALRLGAESGS